MNSQQLQRALNHQKKQTSFAWAKYYESENIALVSDTQQYTIICRVIEEGGDMPTHIIRELEEQSIALKKKIECPICLEVIQEGRLNITRCGHKYCKTCLDKIKNTTKECAVCRRKICK